MKIVRRLCDELDKTVILVLHEINYAAFYSDYICAFKDGKIAKFGTVKEVMTREVLSRIYQVDFEIMEIQGKPLSIYYDEKETVIRFSFHHGGESGAYCLRYGPDAHRQYNPLFRKHAKPGVCSAG